MTERLLPNTQTICGKNFCGETAGLRMDINEILKNRGMTKYRLAVLSGVPHTTLNNICSGQAKIEKCSAETLYKPAYERKRYSEENNTF